MIDKSDVRSRFKTRTVNFCKDCLTGELNVTLFNKDPVGISIAVVMGGLVETLKNGEADEIECELTPVFDRIVTETALWAYKEGMKEAGRDK
ncbi:MAG: hypothetical protein LBH43_00630 [Treponema sp.]|jgi:hypothetical protein|nr:hypothetical protein [Treponema sp.]